jgi:F-type H+-transporting ATPase subunit b
MSVLSHLPLLAAAAEEHHGDPARSKSWIWPEQAELIYGTTSSIIIFALLFKFAGPMIAKAFNGRTQAIQAELDASAAAQASAQAEAAQIRQAAGDIDSERQRLFAEADAQAEALLTEGRARLEAELAELNARADADIVLAGSRVNDELRAEITRLANAATEQTLAAGAIDAATQQELIENFIQRVGADGVGASA